MPYEIIKQPQQFTKVNVLSSIAFNDVDTGLLLSNSKYPFLSAQYSNIYSNISGTATYALPGGLIIKGQSPTYDITALNLPGFGNYGLYIQNVTNMDPGTTLVSDGRGAVTHAMNFRAGITNFTAGADHSHVLWSSSPFNPTQTWQMIQGGDNFKDNRFMVHTLPQYQLTTVITAQNGGYVDTNSAELLTGTDRLTGVKINVIDPAGISNYSLININDAIGLQFNPGVAGLVAATYQSRLTDKSYSAGLSTFTFDLFIGNPTNWVPSLKSNTFVSLSSRAQGGNPGVNYISSTIGNPSTDYVGLTGCYRNLAKHILARFTNSSLISGFKTGSPITLWVPNGMIPSNLIYGTSLSPRYGFMDAYVRTVSGTDMEIVLGSLIDTYNFNTYSNNVTAAGNAGWVLIGGSIDTVHRPTFGTTGFYFEREPWASGVNNWLSGGLIKNTVLGCAESFGNYSYSIGHRGVNVGNYSGVFAGNGNVVYSNNSAAIGGNELISLSSNQVVIGNYNNPNTDSLFVIGNGADNNNRKNALEVTIDGTVINDFNIYTTINSNYIFSDIDKGRTFHVNNLSTPLTASFPSYLTDGFNINLILLGSNTVTLSSTNTPYLCASFTELSDPFTQTLFYKNNNLIYGIKGGGGGGGTLPTYSAEVLIVGGGGSGVIGGGGAGGFTATTTTILQGQTYGVTVGAGGAGVTFGTNNGNNGNLSQFGSLVSLGGGSGGSLAGNAGSGGSGGGAASAGTDRYGGAGTAGQGFDGGDVITFGSLAAGGGGSGQEGYSNIGGSGTGTAGGSGLIWLDSVYYAGGGGGAASTGSPGLSGLGGGGNGGKPLQSPTNGIANTGGGGGGAFETASGSGGSGIVIIRYLGGTRGTGGTITSSGGYTYHTFTGSGLYTG